jgi:hypothetical protein
MNQLRHSVRRVVVLAEPSYISVVFAHARDKLAPRWCLRAMPQPEVAVSKSTGMFILS